MIRPLLHSIVQRFEKRYGYDATYMHEIADTSVGAFMKLALAQAMNTHREAVSLDALFAARITAVRFEDCGPCAQLVVNMALEAGVAPAMVRAIVARDADRMSSDAATRHAARRRGARARVDATRRARRRLRVSGRKDW